MKTRWIDFTAYLTGSVLYALSVSVFSAPNDMAPGGASGVGIMVQALVGIPVGLVVLLINVPLLIAAYFQLSHGFVWRSALVIVLSSVVMDVTAAVVPPFRGDTMLAALCGGLLSGIGIGLIMWRLASTGGSDIVARLLQKRHPHLSVGRLVLVVDAVVIALSVAVFGELMAALYAAVQAFVCSLMIDVVVYGREEGRLLMVVTEHPQWLSRAVTKELSRGVTVLKASGGYTGKERTLLLCAVSRTQVPAFKRVIGQTDPSAFVMIVTTQQVVGEGFLPPES